MNKLNRLFSFLTLIILIGCKTEPLPLPELTYTGTEPRVQNPLSPEDSQRHIQVPEGFKVELFAAEPNIINPIAFTWDEKGRLWVVQSQDYPHGLANDVGGDRITICEDTNRDGKADKFIDFATQQSLTTGITVVKGGIIVAQAPNMVFLEDTDGDDKMDKSTVLFDGFGTWDTHAGPANLKYGLDNTIWGSVGYSGFENRFNNKTINFTMGVFKFSKDGKYFEPIGRFNNNTWGLGFNENFEIFGSTANNNHACYVGIPLRHYEYLGKRPDWALNADFIQGHYEISPADTIPLQQVDVRGGYTAAAGANFYTARNYPKKYQNQMYVNEPTGHLVHIANIEKEGAGYKEVDGGNIFASTDAWTAPVFSETGPDGNLWVADWYNPVIQHNPDKRGMDNQIWNDDKGEGNAHKNPLRDKGHGRIYILKYKGKEDNDIKTLNPNNGEDLLEALQSDNMFWRTTAQRLIVENKKTELIPDIIKLAKQNNTTALHALWTLDGLNVTKNNKEVQELVVSSLKNGTYAIQRAALELLPNTLESSKLLEESGLLTSKDLQVQLAAILRANELPETVGLAKIVNEIGKKTTDKWVSAATKLFFKTQNTNAVDPKTLDIVLPTAEIKSITWQYTTEKPNENWTNKNFKDNEWKTGKTQFNRDDIEVANTKWDTKDIRMRTTFTANQDIEEPILKIVHSGDYEVYLNGELFHSGKGEKWEYQYIKINTPIKKGKHTIAVHCKGNNTPRSYIDIGIGKKIKPKADVVFNINTVSQKMAFDKTVLRATVGQTIEIVLNNKDQMPHNLVLLDKESLDNFGVLVDEFLKSPDAEKMNYVPRSKYVLGATGMLNPTEKEAIQITLPNVPGRYPFVCTFPGHWRIMQGVLIVEAVGSYISNNTNATKITSMGGGGSHNFLKFFGIDDGKILSDNGKNSVIYTEDSRELGSLIPETDILYLSANKAIDTETRKTIFSKVNDGKLNMLINHPSTWYNWKDWPKYNNELVGGGSTSHEKLGLFEVKVIQPSHPIMKGVPAKFRIYDELYRWKKDPEGTEIEVLAMGRGLKSGEEFPVVWIVKHPKAKIVGNTLGHDERAHNLKAYQTILRNSMHWVKE